MKPITKCIFPAAGFGTRFLPATKSMPKEMLPVVNKPLIHFAVEEAIDAGMIDMGIIYGRYKKAIPDYFDSHVELEIMLRNSSKKQYLHQLNLMIDSVNFMYIRQNKALGLGHAILTAQSLIGESPFGVVLADDLCLNLDKNKLSVLKQMQQIYQQHNPACLIAVEDVPEDQVDKYGIVEGEAIDESLVKVTNLTEKPKRNEAKSTLAVIGRYMLSNDIFRPLSHLRDEQKTTGDNSEMQITTAINQMVQAGYPVLAYRFKGKRFDCGSISGMMEATKFVYDNKLYVS